MSSNATYSEPSTTATTTTVRVHPRGEGLSLTDLKLGTKGSSQCPTLSHLVHSLDIVMAPYNKDSKHIIYFYFFLYLLSYPCLQSISISCDIPTTSYFFFSWKTVLWFLGSTVSNNFSQHNKVQMYCILDYISNISISKYYTIHHVLIACREWSHSIWHIEDKIVNDLNNERHSRICCVRGTKPTAFSATLTDFSKWSVATFVVSTDIGINTWTMQSDCSYARA